jgi:chemotaxis response regulator CheB
MKNVKVFTIDDSPFYRRLFEKMLLAVPGIRIIGEAKDALTALKFIRRFKPDVIVMDIKTQWSFGIDLMKNLRRVTSIPKVIMLAGESCFRYQSKAERADFFLDKFTEYEKIPEILKRLTSNTPFEPGREKERYS